ncbi:MAG: SAM-dependent methyltransferase [Planctomycetota bacterium]
MSTACDMSDSPAAFPYDPIEGYELLDSGDGEKLEQVGGVLLRRPDPQAMWRPALPPARWQAADLRFVRESDRGGRWEARGGPARIAPPESWELAHRGARFIVRPTPFKHIGIFPEQSANWLFTAQRLAAHCAGPRADTQGTRPTEDSRPAVLNLFAYTGVATVLAAKAGAFVTHVDSSRPSLRWAKENAERSALPGDSVRWIEDDAVRFVQREARRGRRYQGILLDPPPYGRGPEGEKWVFEEQVAELLRACHGLLAEGPAFLVLSCYAVGTSPLAFLNMLDDLESRSASSAKVQVQAGELAIPQTAGGHAGRPRLLPAGLCGRWWRGP